MFSVRRFVGGVQTKPKTKEIPVRIRSKSVAKSGNVASNSKTQSFVKAKKIKQKEKSTSRKGLKRTIEPEVEAATKSKKKRSSRNTGKFSSVDPSGIEERNEDSQTKNSHPESFESYDTKELRLCQNDEAMPKENDEAVNTRVDIDPAEDREDFDIPISSHAESSNAAIESVKSETSEQFIQSAASMHESIEDEHDVYRRSSRPDFLDGRITFFDASLEPCSVETTRSTVGESILTILADTMGIKSLFPMQCSIIEGILAARKRSLDVCISAPTGSGKTLAYALPIIKQLSIRVVPRLRALILLPTRELVHQVAGVFDPFCKAFRLKLATVTGQRSIEAERTKLVLSSGYGGDRGGRANVDILVATPGRLVDHIQCTPGFSLQHVEFLVIDEADRLLSQHYHDWVRLILDSSRQKISGQIIRDDDSGLIKQIDPTCDRSCRWTNSNSTPLQRILVSATLTQDPQQLSRLKLRNPLYYASSSRRRFTLPASLSQHLVVCDAADKPAALIKHLIEDTPLNARALIFTSSVESTHRLTRLLELYGGILDGCVNEFSAQLPQARRSKILESFRSNSSRDRIIVCSDAVARGVDVAGVQLVINYDAPMHLETYIHRSGRCARAGAHGTVVTFAEPNVAHRFTTMVAEADKSLLHRRAVASEDLSRVVDRYQQALESLADVLRAEKRGEIFIFRRLDQQLDPEGVNADLVERVLERFGHVDESEHESDADSDDGRA